jgi:hypothetical protein
LSRSRPLAKARANRLLGLWRRSESVRRKLEIMPLTSPQVLQGEAAPIRRQVRAMLGRFIPEVRTSEAEHDSLPKAAKRRSVNAAGSITHIVG